MGSYLALNHTLWINYCKAGLMSNGCNHHRCKVFDDSARGFIRGDAVGGFYMSSLYEELDGERLKIGGLPLIGGMAAAITMHNGTAMSTAGPSNASQQEILHETLRRANIAAASVDVAECHGEA